MINPTPELNRKPQILVVDDEVAMVRSLELLLKPVGDITKAYSVPEAEEALAKTQRVDCIITDVSMPEASGLTLLDQVRRKSPEIPVIVMTAYSSVPQAVEAMQKGAFEYIVKPFENRDLVEVVKKAIVARGITKGETKAMPTGWICNSRSMIEFLAKLEKFAETDSSLLLLGETGVGKSRAARWIHDRGNTKKLDFFSIDGRAHEEDHSVLTASISKVGTLFIAEVFSLPKKIQDRLYEIILDGKCRVIASSSVSPELQAMDHFREDLLKALSIHTLKVPSLKDRAEDLEALVRETLLGLTAKMKLKKLEVEPRALEKLKAYSFPGNVKELERVLERAAIQAKAGVITEDALHFEASDLKQLLPFSIPLEDGWNRLELLRESLERELIIRALEKFPSYSNTQIASHLGTTRRILELRMKAYRIREGS